MGCLLEGLQWWYAGTHATPRHATRRDAMRRDARAHARTCARTCLHSLTHLCTGTRSRTIHCMNSSDTKASTVVEASLCLEGFAPFVSENCNLQPCSWRHGEWSRCSTTCGPGEQTRQVECRDSAADSAKIISQDQCAGEPQPRSEHARIHAPCMHACRCTHIGTQVHGYMGTQAHGYTRYTGTWLLGTWAHRNTRYTGRSEHGHACRHTEVQRLCHVCTHVGALVAVCLCTCPYMHVYTDIHV